MPRALAVPIRQTILACHRQGQQAPAIAARLQLRLRTVQNLLRRFRKDPQAVAPAYRGPTRPDHPLLQAALQCRRDHPTWGTELIRVHLLGPGPKEDNPAKKADTDLPSARTLQRWFRAAGLGPAPPGRKAPSRPRAETPHDVWQMDAAEHLPPATGAQAS